MEKKIKVRNSVQILILLGVFSILNINSSSLSAEELHAHPGSIVFSAVQGQSPAETRSVFIFSAFGSSISWSQSKNVPWLTPNLQNGNTDAVLRIGVNSSGMSAGIYYGNITLTSAQSTTGPIIIQVTLIINPDVPVKIATWKEGYSGAMSVSVDDGQPSGFADLQANGFSGTYVSLGTSPPSFYTDYYNAGMELGSHTVSHPCHSVSDYDLRYQELEPNILGLHTYTPAPREEIISLVWPCGYTNYREQAIASEYFLSARGYNINKLEDATPENFMNLKSYNSHEHTPYPPSDLKTVVDEAVLQRKWFNLVLHGSNNDDGATNYASSKDIWVTSIGSVIKYILQRDRFVLTDYNTSSNNITYHVSRLQIPSSPLRNFEESFGQNDIVTMQVDVDDNKVIEYVSIDGLSNPFQIKDLNGNKILIANIRLESASIKAIEIKFLNQSTTALTISGVTAQSKVYNGTTSATLNTGSAALVGVLPGDVVTLNKSGARGSFTNKNAGTSKTVLTSGFTLGGIDAGKYYLVSPTLVANIYRADLTISGLTVDDKVYDGTTEAFLNSENAFLSGVFGTDQVRIVSTGAGGTFEDKNVGLYIPVSLYGFTLAGTDRNNYTLMQPSAAADIIHAELTVSGVTANNKVYDGTTTATLNTQGAALEGVFGQDDVTLVTAGASGRFEDEKAGTNKVVTTSGFTIEGPDAYNYYLTQPTTTASITKIILTISGVTANNKVYNRSTNATLNTAGAILVGVSGSDIVTLISTGATGSFANKNAGTGKTVTTTGFSLGGRDASRYSITQPSTTASISKANISISGVTANNKIYNGTTVATLNTGSASFSGVFTGDIVTLVSSGATGTFINKDVGTSKLVSTSGFSPGGGDAGNYSVIQPSTTANITKANLTVSGLTASSKIYDGTTSATLNTGGTILTGLIPGDIVSLVSSGAVGSFANKNSATGKLVSASGFSIVGNDAGNYNLTQPSALADIYKAELTVSGIKAINKVYNSTTLAALNTGNASIMGLLPGDIVSLVSTSATGNFVNKNAGISKTVTTSGFTLTGADGGNYSLIQPLSMADITKATITVSGVTANSKVYDGTTAASLNSAGAFLTGVFVGDIVTLISAAATGEFISRDAGTGKAVLISGFSLGGADSDNYNMTQPIATAGIAPRSLTVTANNLSKPYRTTFTFTGTEYSVANLVPGDAITGITLSSSGANAAADVGKYVIAISGGSNSNYNFVYSNGILTITKSVIRIKADNNTKVYRSENPALTLTYTGFINNEDISVIDETPVASTSALTVSDAGTYPIKLTGGHDNNYDLLLEDGILQILKAPLVVKADDKTKVYKEINPELTISYSGFKDGQNERDIDILPSAETDVFPESDAGVYEINLSGASDKNYDFIYIKGTLSIKKADQDITFAGIPSGLRMTQEYTLNATATSGLDVRFEVSDPGIASLNGKLLTVMKDGNFTVKAIQEGDNNWNPAPEQSQSVITLPTFDGISSLFTPNNDGMNDYWYIPELEKYGRIQVTVFNRYGQAVYKSDSYENNWDGTWNGNPLPSASYYYIIRSSKMGFIKGVVNIAR